MLSGIILVTCVLAQIIGAIAQGDEPISCQPGTVFKHYCNECFCDELGKGPTCTKMYCSPKIFNKDGTLKNPEAKPKIQKESSICEPGKEFKYFCNLCTCSQDGLGRACTKKYCMPGLYNEDGSYAITSDKVSPQHDLKKIDNSPKASGSRMCEPGKFYRIDCNHCACSSKGILFCSHKKCSSEEKIIKRRHTAIVPLLPTLTDRKCVPGMSYRKNCNMCFCNKDGIVACQVNECERT